MDTLTEKVAVITGAASGSNAAFLPLLLNQRSGHVVNTASFAGLFQLFL